MRRRPPARHRAADAGARCRRARSTRRGRTRWLLFQGRWGEFQKPPYDAPPGPRTKEEWSEPIVWQESLRDGSVAVPSGTTLGPTATGAFCAVVDAGGKIYTAITSPLVLVLIVVGLVMTGTAAARSTVWAPHVPHPLRRTRAAGQMLGAARGVYRERRRVLLPIGLLFLPAAVLEVALQQVVLELTPLGDLTAVAGRSSLVSIALALFVAGAGHVLAATVVVGGVALVMDAAERGGGVDIREAFRLTARAAPRLLRTAIRAGAIVVLLAVTVVGIPLAVWTLGRWAVAVQVSALEGVPPARPLRAAARWCAAAGGAPRRSPRP